MKECALSLALKSWSKKQGTHGPRKKGEAEVVSESGSGADPGQQKPMAGGGISGHKEETFCQESRKALSGMEGEKVSWKVRSP